MKPTWIISDRGKVKKVHYLVHGTNNGICGAWLGEKREVFLSSKTKPNGPIFCKNCLKKTK